MRGGRVKSLYCPDHHRRSVITDHNPGAPLGTAFPFIAVIFVGKSLENAESGFVQTRTKLPEPSVPVSSLMSFVTS